MGILGIFKPGRLDRKRIGSRWIRMDVCFTSRLDLFNLFLVIALALP